MSQYKDTWSVESASFHCQGLCAPAGRKQYTLALERLQSVITAPTMVVNAITMSAYKKWVLVSIILHGKVRAGG